MTTAEVASLADSIRSVVADIPTPGTWSPEAPSTDQVPRLRAALAEVGWYDLADDDDALAFVGPAAAELGRRLVALSELDSLLGGSPCVSGMTRYAALGDHVVIPGRDGLRAAAVMTMDPLAYGDAIGAAHVTVAVGSAVEPAEAVRRERAWLSATVGYLAGVADAAVGLALQHVKTRPAFGGTLAALPSVQQRLAEAAMLRDGLVLLARETPDFNALAYAGQACCAAVAECHQVVGAIGFTLEFPMQRFSRRARAVQLWADAWIDARV